MTSIKYSKGQIIQQAGKISNQVYLVKKGLLYSYIIDDKGKQHVFMFAPEEWLVADSFSHANMTPSQLHIEALEDSEVLIITKEYINTLNSDLNLINKEFDKLISRIATLQQRLLLQLSSSAEERYQHFLQSYPELINRVPLKLIASYIGITPETLSNIRKNQIRKRT